MDARSQSLSMTRLTFVGASSNEHWLRMSFAPRISAPIRRAESGERPAVAVAEEMRGELFKVLVAIKDERGLTPALSEHPITAPSASSTASCRGTRTPTSKACRTPVVWVPKLCSRRRSAPLAGRNRVFCTPQPARAQPDVPVWYPRLVVCSHNREPRAWMRPIATMNSRGFVVRCARRLVGVVDASFRSRRCVPLGRGRVRRGRRPLARSRR
jgi:hypothetical protein